MKTRHSPVLFRCGPLTESDSAWLSSVGSFSICFPAPGLELLSGARLSGVGENIPHGARKSRRKTGAVVVLFLSLRYHGGRFCTPMRPGGPARKNGLRGTRPKLDDEKKTVSYESLRELLEARAAATPEKVFLFSES